VDGIKNHRQPFPYRANGLEVCTSGIMAIYCGPGSDIYCISYPTQLCKSGLKHLAQSQTLLFFILHAHEKVDLSLTQWSSRNATVKELTCTGIGVTDVGCHSSPPSPSSTLTKPGDPFSAG